MRQLVMWVAVLGLLLGLAACGDTSPELKKVGEKAGETWDAFKTWSVTKRKDVQGWWEDKGSKEVQGLYESAKKKAADMGEGASETFDKEWAVVKEKAKAMHEASDEEWEKAKTAFVEAVESAKKKFAGE